MGDESGALTGRVGVGGVIHQRAEAVGDAVDAPGAVEAGQRAVGRRHAVLLGGRRFQRGGAALQQVTHQGVG
ncbi:MULTISPECIES: hypothetical protein [Streptomyces]|uniref:hypothetical protein n=1 Tax=Streptomyces sp. SID5464 TaxID=2690293 RepID=UPI0015703C9B|nr:MULTISPECIES: hypothetical protein [Streptomyces]